MSPPSPSLAALHPHCQAYSAPIWADLLCTAFGEGRITKMALRLGCLLQGHFNHGTGLCHRSMRLIRRNPEGHPTLPEQLGVCIRTVRRAAKSLTDAGLIFRYQMSRHRCNRFQAVMGPPPPMLSKALDDEPEDSPEVVQEESPPMVSDDNGHPDEKENKKMSAVGGHSLICPPRTGFGTETVSEGTRVAPWGLTERPLPDILPSSERERCRQTLRQLGVGGLVVAYLCLTCTNQELDWVVREALVARAPGRWCIWAHNELAAGRVTPGRRRKRPPGASITWVDGKPYRQKTAAELEEERNPAPPEPEPEPELWTEPEKFDAAWDVLSPDVQGEVMAASVWNLLHPHHPLSHFDKLVQNGRTEEDIHRQILFETCRQLRVELVAARAERGTK